MRVVDADGTAAPLAWNLGTIAGTNVLRATTEGVPDVQFDAIGERGPASQIVAFEGDDQVADTGSEVPLPPRVLVADDVGNGVPGATVVFAVETGGGSVTGDTVTTGLDGTASVGSWTLGGQLGVQTLVATTDSVPGDTARFDVTTTAAVSVLFIVAGESQDAEVNTTVDIAPTIRAEDEFGNPAAGAEVTFEVIQGGGSVPTNVVVTDAGGLATVPSWRVGADFAANVLRASGGDATPVEFTANGVASTSDYDIEIRYLGSVTLSQQQAFAEARAKWRAAITGDVPAVQLTNATCAGRATLNEIVDDLLILAEIRPIDGPGNILGSAGPCFVRSNGLLPIAGIMSFDDADLANLETSGLLDEVIVHEMGHVLGIGTIWSELGLLTGAGTNDPIFTGAGAIQAFLDVGGDTYAGDPVPVANTGGAGTRDAHWRESVFDNELMTGFLDAGANPLSIVSIASLADLGYVVDLGAADAYSLPEPGMAAARETAGKFRLIEAPLPPPRRLP